MNMTAAGYHNQKLIECSICLQAFTDPRMLPCIHTFCLECLKETSNLATKKPRGNMACPLCGQFFAIPPDGLDGLQKNFFVEHLLEVTTSLQLSSTSIIACDICKYLYEGVEKTKSATMCCLECRDNFCDICAKAHNLHKASKDHHILKIGEQIEAEMSSISPNRNCIDHNGKSLDYYCPKCKKIVCVSCVIEKHGSHECKNLSTIGEQFRQAIEISAVKISIYADELSSKRREVEDRKKNLHSKLADTENEIRQRNLELKEMIDRDTNILLEELSLLNQKQIEVCDNENEEIERIFSILKGFETYCTELRMKGSASDICSCVNELIMRANDLERGHEAFIGRLCQWADISFKGSDLGELQNTLQNNIVGRIQETRLQVENCVLITGLDDGHTLTNEVFKLNLRRPHEISTEPELPTEMQYGATAEFYFNTMYITGVGVNYDEIWEYNLASGWMKCASLVQSRNYHCAAFVDKVLYICGGYVVSDKRILDSVEGYNTITNTCRIVGKLVHCVQVSGNCVPYKGLLYIFGGTDDDDHSMDHVQMYDTKLNTCTLLSKPMPRRIHFLRAVLLETSVILLGRDTCFIFNFETKTWQERKQFKTDVYYFGVAHENDRIFVIGGGIRHKDGAGKVTWTCRDDIRYVLLKCVIDDKPIEWKNFSKLPKPAMIETYGKNCNFLPDVRNTQTFI